MNAPPFLPMFVFFAPPPSRSARVGGTFSHAVYLCGRHVSAWALAKAGERVADEAATPAKLRINPNSLFQMTSCARLRAKIASSARFSDKLASFFAYNMRR